ncbi:MAG: ATP-binding protein [Actinobacteria bacterium]|nr:ATP-binding protein [Actinomycetota bacterium]
MTPSPSPLFPLRYARGNLLFGRGDERVGLYRLPMVSYPFKPVADKWHELRRLERLAITVGADFSLWRVQRAYPAERYAAQVDELLDDRHQSHADWQAYLAGHTGRLRSLGSHLPELYLAVSLKDPAPARFGGGLIRASDRARRRIEDLAAVGSPQPVSHRDLVALAGAEQRVFEWVRRIYGAERATTDELQWLLRRAACRGVAEPRLDSHWQPDALVLEDDYGPVYEPLESDLWRLLNAPVLEQTRTDRGDDPHGARLIIDAEEGHSYQTVMTLGALADDPYFPGGRAELLFEPLEALDFPVDAVLHARWLGNREALAQVRKRIMEVDNAYAEAAAGSRLQAGDHPPMLYASVSYVLGASSDRALEQRASTLQDTFGDILLHRPNMLQELLFYDALPRAGGGRVLDYVQQMTTEQFAAMMPAGTTRVGSNRGIYIGWTPGGGARPVKTDPTEASQRSRTTAVAFVGGLGSGKTVSAQLYAFGAVMRGSQVVTTDSKQPVDGRYEHGFDRVAELEWRVDIIELSGAASEHGKLDPLVIGLDDYREQLAASYFITLLGDPPGAQQNAIKRAILDVVRRGERSSRAVIDELLRADDPHAREAGDSLDVLSNFGLASLGLGRRAQSAGAERAAADVTTIRMPGLVLPDPSATRSEYEDIERISVATLHLAAAYQLRLVAHDRQRHKIILLDETRFLLGSAQGRAIVTKLILAGRAVNATIALAVQRLDYLGDLEELIGTMFVFGQESDADARRALEFLGLDPEERGLVQMLRTWAQSEEIHGRCLMRDLDGRIGELQFDPVYAHLLEAFNTTPPKARKTVEVAR